MDQQAERAPWLYERVTRAEVLLERIEKRLDELPAQVARDCEVRDQLARADIQQAFEKRLDDCLVVFREEMRREYTACFDAGQKIDWPMMIRGGLVALAIILALVQYMTTGDASGFQRAL